MDRWKTLNIEAKGGLNTSTDTLSYMPGEAVQLINYEAGIYGGYRRINGYTKYSTTAVTGTGSILGVHIRATNNSVIACRGANVMYSTGSTWTSITTGRTNAGRYQFTRYYFNSGERHAMCDGVNPAATWDGTTYTLINGTGAPSNPKYCTFFNQCLVLAGMSAAPQTFVMSAPLTDNDFNGADGAIVISVAQDITGVRAFRGNLYIFCKNQIFQLVGQTSANYVLTPVSTGIGTLLWDSIQEVNGDLVYAAEDGIRTLSGTMKLNDVELGTLSKPILNTANQIDHLIAGNPDNVSSVAIREKNQYRIFYSTPGLSPSNAPGIIGAIRPGKQMMTQFGTYISVWEWSTTLGIMPTCCDSYITGTTELAVMGMNDGITYTLENGNSFNSVNIVSSYTTAPLQLEDTEIRKLLQKITVYTHLEGSAQITCQPIYDFNDTTLIMQSPSILFVSQSGISNYGSSLYGSGVYGGSILPELHSNITGSGKIVQFSFTTNDMNPSHSIQGISIQYRPLGRR